MTIARHDLARRFSEFKHAKLRAFRNAHYEDAAHICQQGMELAETYGADQELVFFRFWYAEALSTMGKRHEAVAALTPLLRQLDGPGRPQDMFNALTLYLDLALEIPLPLKDITDSMGFCYDYLARINKREWRPMLVLQEAQILQLQGRFEQALEKAQEAWGIWQPVYPYYTADTHIKRIIDYALRCRRPALVHEYLALWRHNRNNERPLSRTYSMAFWQTALLRLEGDLDGALTMGQRCLTHARHCSKEDHGYAALARVYLARGEINKARMALRHLPLKFMRENPFTLMDFHLAEARAAAGMPPADEQYSTDFPPPTSIADPAATRRASARVRAIYPLAVRYVARWDTAFECTWRGEALATRMARLDAIHDALRKT